jgi:uncharacterized protein YbaP (TraB family)
LRADDYPLPAAYDEAYRAAGRVVVEVESGAGGEAANRRFLEAGSYPPDDSLRSHVPSQTYEKLTRVFHRLGLSEEAMSRFRPWMVAATVAVSHYTRLGARAELGVDRHFQRRAALDGKAVEALESVDQQIEAFRSLGEAEQLQMLEQTVAEATSAGGEATKLMEAWRDGDADRLAELVFRDIESYLGIFEALMFARNRKWLPELERIAASGEPAMVIVGAGHLVGDHGLVALLRRRGHRVVQVEAGSG